MATFPENITSGPQLVTCHPAVVDGPETVGGSQALFVLVSASIGSTVNVTVNGHGQTNKEKTNNSDQWKEGMNGMRCLWISGKAAS